MEKVPSQEVLGKSITITLINKSGNKIDEFNMRAGTNLWVFLRKRGIPIGAACSGVGVCGACDLKIISKNPEAVSIQNNFEKETLLKNKKLSEHRLACLCRVFSDVTVQADYW